MFLFASEGKLVCHEHPQLPSQPIPFRMMHPLSRLVPFDSERRRSSSERLSVVRITSRVDQSMPAGNGVAFVTQVFRQIFFHL